MKEYLYDPHTHTAETSKCGHLPAAEVVDRYAGHGFSGLVVTDHLHPEYLRLAGSDTHEDGDECRAGVLLPERVRDSFAYRRMIEGRRFRLWSPVFPELAAADEALRRAEPAE